MIKKIIKNNLGLSILLLFSFIVHILAILDLGVTYNINSDDLSYIDSAFIFLKTFSITMHGPISAQAMPGMTFLLAFISLLFGEGKLFFLVTKLVWIVFSLLSIVGLYKIITQYASKKAAIIGCLFLLAPDFIWTDNVILSETPFLTCFIWLIYFSIKLVDTKEWKYLWLIIILYISAIMLKANIAIYPIFLFIYMLIKKYDFKLIIKQGLIGGLIVLFIISPWIIRNYIQFDRFIPLTYGIGNPLLLGSYQGYGYPPDSELDYHNNVDLKLSDEMKTYLSLDSSTNDKMYKYYLLQYDEIKAKYRMSEWWNNDKKSMLISYLIKKPVILLVGSFYWDEVFDIPVSVNIFIRKIEIVITFLAFLAIIIEKDKNKMKTLGFLLIIYISQILVYSYTFAYSRYGHTLYFIRFIIIGIGIQSTYNLIKRRSKNAISN